MTQILHTLTRFLDILTCFLVILGQYKVEELTTIWLNHHYFHERKLAQYNQETCQDIQETCQGVQDLCHEDL